MANERRRKFLQQVAGGMMFATLPACRNESARMPLQGDQFPEITLPNLDGHTVTTATYSGAALIVNFWATWCEPCRREMPSLQRLSTLYRHEDLWVIGVAVDEDLNLVREFLLRYNITFPQFSDLHQTLSKTSLQITAFPMTYLVTRDRYIARVVVGERDWTDANAIKDIEEVLNLKPRVKG